MASGANIPKSHHFVAQMHLARFADAKGKMWAFNKAGGRLFYAATPAVFAETHLYTVESAEGVKDTSLETAFSKLEGDANGVIEKIVSATRAGDPIPLTPEDRVIWDAYFYMQWKRVPDILAQVETLQDAEAWLDEFFAAKRAEQPERAAEIDALDTPEECKRLIQGAKVGAIRRNPGTVLQALQSRGLAALQITAPGESFAIGSQPIVRNSDSLLAPQAEAWLPIASDIAVGPGHEPGTITTFAFEDPHEIWRFNCKMAWQSSMFAAGSKALMERLVAAVGAPADAPAPVM